MYVVEQVDVILCGSNTNGRHHRDQFPTTTDLPNANPRPEATGSRDMSVDSGSQGEQEWSS